MENHVGEEATKMVPHTEDVHVEDPAVEEVDVDGMIYKVTDNPPMHLTILFAFQVSGYNYTYLKLCNAMDLLP